MYEELPSNLTIIKLENINEELPKYFKNLGLEVGSVIPHTNKTKHKEFNQYYNDDLINLVQEKESWIYNNGYYVRGELL